VPDSINEFYRKAPPDRGASSFIYPPTAGNLRFFSEALRAGCLVAIPTETVYGLAGLALDPDACRSIFSLKGRPLIDPLIVHVSSMEMLESLADVTTQARQVISNFWPGPLTLILKKKPVVPDIVTAGRNTVAVRMPRHPVAQQLLHDLKAPLAAPSANPFGYISPSKAAHVADSFGERVPFIIDGGESEIGLESTIVDLSDPASVTILRPGAISAQELSAVLQCPVSHHRKEAADTNVAQQAPGMLASHYSPQTPLSLFPHDSLPHALEGEAVILLKASAAGLRQENFYWFSESGSSEEIARNLFSLLRQADRQGYRRIHCELPPAATDGLLLAIRDRLTRAAAKKKAGGS
jgi:L-threonylcarbamoyladenylate synthase